MDEIWENLSQVRVNHLKGCPQSSKNVVNEKDLQYFGVIYRFLSEFDRRFTENLPFLKALISTDYKS